MCVVTFSNKILRSSLRHSIEHSVFITMSGSILPLRTLSRSSPFKILTPSLYNSTKQYGQASKGHEHKRHKAPSTAEVIEEVAEEKLQAAKQGIANQTSEKTNGGIEEATLGDANVDSVKKRFEEQEPGADYRRKGDE